jgi:hypothetical protein
MDGEGTRLSIRNLAFVPSSSIFCSSNFFEKEEKFEIPATRCHPWNLFIFYLEPQIFVFITQGRHLLDGHLALVAPLGVA